MDQVRPGRTALDPAQAHHVRDVLRLDAGAALEVFDRSGRVGQGVLERVAADAVEVRVEQVMEAGAGRVHLTLAAAVPKGSRADWMIEKLSELGVDRFVPLAAKRSVVLPEGKNKLERWRRLALESAKQSRRSGVMEIDAVVPLESAIQRCGTEGALGYVATTELPGTPLGALVCGSAGRAESTSPLWVFIGPEGGWDAGELAAMQQARLTPITLGETILRIETAALAAAAVIAVLRYSFNQNQST